MVIKQSNVGYWSIRKITMCSVVSVDMVAVRRVRKEAYDSVTKAVVNAIDVLCRFRTECELLDIRIKLLRNVKFTDKRTV